jgi:hypothetical protein
VVKFRSRLLNSGVCVGTRGALDVTEKRNISWPRRESSPESPVVYPIAWSLYWLSYPGCLISWSWFPPMHPIVIFFLILLVAKRTVSISNENRHTLSCITKSYSCYETQYTIHAKLSFTTVIHVVVARC